MLLWLETDRREDRRRINKMLAQNSTGTDTDCAIKKSAANAR